MKLGQGLFAVKLNELERNYDHMQIRLRLCRGEDHEKIRQERENLLDECLENELVLQRHVENSQSKAVSELSAAQMSYEKKVRSILEQKLPKYLRSENGDVQSEQAEAMMLYAEYAIDFAVQAARHALLAVLSAIDLQMECEEAEKTDKNISS